VPKRTKIDELINIIKQNPGGQFLIFSGWSNSFGEIQNKLRREGLNSGSLTTSIKTESTLEKFRNGTLKIILLDSTCNGAGIEIPQATDVILFHEMKTSLEIQSIARAQRPGRVGQLRVWKLAFPHEYQAAAPAAVIDEIQAIDAAAAV
jgi:superfamily II DNA/RNA helicase